MPMPTVRVRLTRPVVVGGQDGKIGDLFDVPRSTAALLVGDGSAELVIPEKPATTVRIENPEHGDPAPQRVAPAPTPKQLKPAERETEEAGSKKK